MLVVAGDDLAVAQDDGAVVALAVDVFRQADDHADALRQFTQQALHGGITRGHEVGALDQVLRRIAAEGQFGKDDQVGLEAIDGLAGPVDDPGGVAFDVADGEVELGEGDSHGDTFRLMPLPGEGWIASRRLQ